ncbi:MAG: Calx-beta domain-containing protein [Stenomitos frigidus ULC029]
MPTQITPLSAVSTTDAALSMPLLLQPEVGGLVDPLSVNRPSQSSRSLLFMDGGVADYQMLLAGVSSGTEVHLLDSSQDAVTQITNTLLGRNGISSLHIVSHGEAGGLDFGTGKLNLQELPEYAAQLQSWSKALTDDADILLYGCNVAQGELGKAFTSILSQLTGADIAASDDLTGGALLGGNWTLETATGFVESSLAFTSATTDRYAPVLGHSRLIINDVSIVEGDSGTSNAIFTVTQTGPGSWNVSVNYATVDGTATAGSDYISTSGTLNFGFNETTKTIAVPIVGDSVAEFGETFSVVLSNAIFGAGGAIGDGTGIGSIGTAITDQTLNEDTPSGAIPFSVNDFNIPSLVLSATSSNQGLIADNNLALGGSNDNRTITVTPTANQFGNATITLQASDGVTTTTQTFNVTVVPVNDAPTLTLSTANSVAYTENSNAVIMDASATVSDIDSTNFDTGTLRANFSVNGTGDDRLIIRNQGTAAGEIGVSGSAITFGGIQIGTFTGGVGTTPLVVTFNSNSSPDAAQALLRNLAYSNVSEAPSTVDRTLSIVLTDGDGGTSTTANKTINVTAVNDAPTVSAPTAIAVTEDITTSLTGISFADVDAGSNPVIATLTVGAGTLAATNGGGVTVGGTATNRTLGGTVTAINSFIAGNNLTYTTALNATTAQTLSVSLNDNGNTGTGGALTSAVNVALNVTAVNDAPTVVAPGAIAILEDTVTALTGITFADVDAGNNPVIATLTVGAGTLAATSDGSVTVGGTATSRTLSGTLTAINSFIAASNVTYIPVPDSVATQTLSVSLNDNGNIGTGGSLSSGVTNISLNVTAVNDAPSFTKGSDQTITAGAGVQTIANWATGFNPGPADEATQTVQAYVVTVDNTAIFAVPPTIDLAGNLIYTPATSLATAATATISVSVRDSGGTANGGTDTSAVQTFTITVKPQPTISVAADSQDEGNSGTTAYTFTVNLSDTSTQEVRVNYATADGTATFADNDYTEASGTLIFAPGETSKTFTVNGSGDNKYENTEVFLVNLSNAINGAIDAGSNSVNGTIVNDDSIPVVNITPTLTQAEGNSGTTPYVFTVTLSNPSFEAIGINYSTSDGTATVADGDYIAATGTVNFAPGETSKTITVNAIGDTKFEPNETFQVALTGAAANSGAVSLGSAITASSTITNDDAQPTISIGNVSQTEGNSGTTPYTFTVSLSNASTQTVAVNYTTADGTATVADSDYAVASGTLSFAPGETSKTITVLVNGDTKFEADQVFSVALSNASNGTLGTSTGTGTIVNDDTRPTISINSVSQTEGNIGTTPYAFTASLSNASDETVTVNYATANGTATLAGNDYTVTSGTVTFTPGVTSQTVTVLGNGDSLIEATETFLVNLTAPTNGTIALGAGTGTGTIVNDDAATLLWRSGTTGTAPTGTGENAVWQLNNFTLQSSYFMPTLADLNWQVISTADFDRDGDADILWRNRSTGENAIWQMNSTGYQTGYFLTTVADLNWRLLDTGDFNGDGTADLVWRNQATGQNAIWQMNNFSVQTTALITTVADTNWQIVSTADFDNDRKTDLLWRNRVTGENAIWQMDGLTTKSSFLITTVADTNWQVAGTADLNSDGIADLVWRNRVTGENALWQMNTTGLQTSSLITAVSDSNWQIAGVADLGGDSTPDLLWRNATTTQTAIWQLSSFSFLQSYLLPNVPTEWSVRPFTIV